mmetsp:Transcript_20135/g.39551  ORF Transcript_20135/g.39551 Transcript_20135/m.39551 type:complete len:816 (-) Transcript_20135:1411-3858(-)
MHSEEPARALHSDAASAAKKRPREEGASTTNANNNNVLAGNGTDHGAPAPPAKNGGDSAVPKKHKITGKNNNSNDDDEGSGRQSENEDNGDEDEDDFEIDESQITKKTVYSNTKNKTGYFEAQISEKVNKNLKYGCKYCEKVLNSAAEVQAHLDKVHRDRNPADKCIRCIICNRCVPSTSDLERHASEMHRRVRKYGCLSCKKRFERLVDVQLHVETAHNANRRHRCPECSKTFGRAGDLKLHIRTVHQGERPHTCEHCGSSFGYRNNLKKHVDTVHRGIRRFQCDICGKRFGRKDHLYRHSENKVCLMERSRQDREGAPTGAVSDNPGAISQMPMLGNIGQSGLMPGTSAILQAQAQAQIQLQRAAAAFLGGHAPHFMGLGGMHGAPSSFPPMNSQMAAHLANNPNFASAMLPFAFQPNLFMHQHHHQQQRAAGNGSETGAASEPGTVPGPSNADASSRGLPSRQGSKGSSTVDTAQEKSKQAAPVLTGKGRKSNNTTSEKTHRGASSSSSTSENATGVVPGNAESRGFDQDQTKPVTSHGDKRGFPTSSAETHDPHNIQQMIYMQQHLQSLQGQHPQQAQHSQQQFGRSPHHLQQDHRQPDQQEDQHHQIPHHVASVQGRRDANEAHQQQRPLRQDYSSVGADAATFNVPNPHQQQQHRTPNSGTGKHSFSAQPGNSQQQNPILQQWLQQHGPNSSGNNISSTKYSGPSVENPYAPSHSGQYYMPRQSHPTAHEVTHRQHPSQTGNNSELNHTQMQPRHQQQNHHPHSQASDLHHQYNSQHHHQLPPQGRETMQLPSERSSVHQQQKQPRRSR